MYCPKCGEKNSSKNRFCQNCGEKLEQDDLELESDVIRITNTVKNKSKKIYENSKEKILKLTKKQKIMIVSIAGLVILSIVFLITGSILTSPNHLAVKYMESIAKLDFESYYDMLDLPNSEFLSKEKFVEKMKLNQQDKTEIQSYRVLSEDEIEDKFESLGKIPFIDWDDYIESESELTKVVIIEYVEKGKTEAEYLPIKFTKEKGTSWLFFPKWVIPVGDFIEENYEVYALKGSKVTFDGIELKEQYLTNESKKENFDLYRLPAVFELPTTIKMVTSTGVELEEETTPNGNGYVPDELKLTEDTYQKFLTIAKDGIHAMFDSTIAGTSFQDFSKDKKWSHYEDDYYTLEKIYENIKSSFTSSFYTYKDVKITEITGENEVDFDDDGYFTLPLQIKYSYTEEFKKYDGSIDSKNKVKEYEVEVSFIIVDGQLYIQSFNRTFAYLF